MTDSYEKQVKAPAKVVTPLAVEGAPLAVEVTALAVEVALPAMEGAPPVMKEPPVGMRGDALKSLPLELRKVAFERGAQEAARVISADIVRDALRRCGKTLREIQSETGLDPAMISRIATGQHKTGPQVWSLMAIAQALDLDLKITLE